MSGNADEPGPPDADLLTLQDVVLRTGVPVRLVLEWIRSGHIAARSSPKGWVVNIDDIRSTARTQPVGSRHDERLPVPATRVRPQRSPIPPPGFAGTPFVASLAEHVYQRIESQDRTQARIARIMRELAEANVATTPSEETPSAEAVSAGVAGWDEETLRMVQRQLRRSTPPQDYSWIRRIIQSWREQQPH